MTRLLVAPDPEHPEHRERHPTEVVLREELALHVIANGGTGAVDVGDRAHGREVQLVVVESGSNVVLRLRDDGGFGTGDATRHD